MTKQHRITRPYQINCFNGINGQNGPNAIIQALTSPPDINKVENSFLGTKEIMKRLPRIEVKDLVYYISSEGRNNERIFRDDDDRLYFINLLRQQKIKSKLNFYGYVLLPKQYTFLFKTYRNNLSKTMHRINSDYANYFNRRHNRKNKLFKDRYKCFVIEKKNYLEEVSRYLHLLPKKVGVAKSLFQYRWSSLPGYITKKKRENWIDYDYILGMFNRKSEEACLNYKNYISRNSKKQIDSPFEYLKRSIILGSEDFKKGVNKKQHLKEIAPLSDEEVLAKKIIELITQSPSWSFLRTKKRKFNQTILSRNASIHFLKKYTDLNNQQISVYFNSLKKSSISQMNRRFTFVKENNEAIKKIFNSLENKLRNIVLKDGWTK